MKLKIALLAALGLMLASCSSDEAFTPTSEDTGVSGSYARFMLAGDYLYIIDDSSIKTLHVADASQPTVIDEREIGFGIESIYRLDERLFIGSSSGLYIYTIGGDGVPELTASLAHSDSPFDRPCDPVVANDSLAFVTLNSTEITQQCGMVQVSFGINELRIYDITDIESPVVINTVAMAGPKGLGLDDTTLFVCDGANGLLVFDVSDPLNIDTIDHKQGFEAYDVIPLDGLLLLVSPERIYQYDYTDLDSILLVAEIEVLP